jgi:uncharacterized membrane protein
VKLRPILALAIGASAALAVGGTLVARRHHHTPFRNSPEASATLEQIDPSVPGYVAPGAVAPGLVAPAPDAELSAANTPVAAVRGLLDALISADARRSFSSLAAQDRATLGPAAAWRDELASLPHYLTYRVTRVEGPMVRTEVTIEPRLDEVVGYIPARAAVTWTTTAEDGGYRVAFASTLTDPDLPSDAAARAAAEGWVAARERCQPGNTYAGNLLGQPVLADALCHATGAYRAGAAGNLASFHNPALLLNAFGAEAPAFVRVVRLEGPHPIEVALAPLGNQWEVVGVMEA